MSSFVASDKLYKLHAQKAFQSYVRSVQLQPRKEVRTIQLCYHGVNFVIMFLSLHVVTLGF